MASGLIKRTIKNMIGGVSQQPPLQRLESQCEEMINCVPSLTEFLKRRNGLKKIRTLDVDIDDDAFIGFIDRSDTEVGIVVVDKHGNVSVFNSLGEQIGKSVQNEYLKSSNPKDDIRLCTIRDYNFLLNTKKEVRTSTTYPSWFTEHLVFIKQAAYDQIYTVNIGGKEFTYITPKTDNGGTYKLSVETIANELVKLIKTQNTNVGYEKVWQCKNRADVGIKNKPPHLIVDDLNLEGSFCGRPIEMIPPSSDTDATYQTCSARLEFYGYAYDTLYLITDPAPIGNIGRVGSNILGRFRYIFPNPPASAVDISNIYHGKGVIKIMTNAEVTTDDGHSNSFITSFSNKCYSISDLPLNAFANYTLKVIGDVANNADNYYVKFLSENNAPSNVASRGGWKETTNHTFRISFYENTMPVLLKLEHNAIKVEEVEWEATKVGDEETNLAPSFAGKCIKDIFFYKNRLGFLTEESVVLSEAGKYFNFFQTTMLALLDSDPIDIAASGVRASALRHVVPYAEGLFVYSDRTLYSLESGEVLSTANVELKPILQFDASLSAAPVVCDTSIYYVNSQDGYNQVREYKPNSNSDSYGYSNDITSHVPKYIEGDIRKVCVSLENGIMFISNGTNTIYCYSFIKDNGELLLSSWHKWEFADKILNIHLYQNKLFVIYTKWTGRPYFGSINIGEGSDHDLTDTEGDYKSSYTYSTYYLRDSSGRVQDIPTLIRTMTLKYKAGSVFKLRVFRKGKLEERNMDKKRDFTRFLAMSKNEDLRVTIESFEGRPFNIIETDMEVIHASRS